MWSGSPRAQIVVQRQDIHDLGAGPPPPLFAPRQPTAASNVVLSPAVVAYWQTHHNGEGTGSPPDFDPATAVAKILGSEIELRDTNVVLIDGVDSGAPTIVGTQHVDPAFTGRDPVAAIVKRSPDLFEFLRCDITLPDLNQQAMMSFLCGRMRP
jgi:hypothetical protein